MDRGNTVVRSSSKIMKEKIKIHLFLWFVGIILLFGNVSFAVVTTDDFDFLMKDDEISASSEKETDPISVNVPKTKWSGVSKLISRLIQENDFALYAGTICGLIFLWIFYSYFTKIRKFTEHAQLAKDLAEKYFYNMQESQFGNEKTKKGADSNIVIPEADLKLLLTKNELDGTVVKEINKFLQKCEIGDKVTVEFGISRS